MSNIYRILVLIVFVGLLFQSCTKQQQPKTAYSKTIQKKKNALDKALIGTWDNGSYFDMVKATKNYIQPDADISPFSIFTFSDDFSDTPTILSSSYEAGSCLFYGKYDSVNNTYNFIADFDSKVGFTIQNIKGSKSFTCVTTTGKKYRYIKHKNNHSRDETVSMYNAALIVGRYQNKDNAEDIIEFGLPDRLLQGFAGYTHYSLNIWSADYNCVLTLYNKKNKSVSAKYYKYKLTAETLVLVPLNEDLEPTGNEVMYTIDNE
jgi:hypothetical protein